MIEITPALESKAFELANNLRFSPEGRQRTSHTEKMWKYRAYQGGEPASMIDWKQSARGRDIIVREHEKISHRHIFFWAMPDSLGPDIQEAAITILLALGYTLVKKERVIGWLSPDLPISRTASMLATLVENGLNQEDSGGQTHNIRNQFIMLSGNFTQSPSEVLEKLRTYAAQGNRGLLLHCSAVKLPNDLAIAKAANNAGWPILSMSEKDRLDIVLADLLEKTLQATR